MAEKPSLDNIREKLNIPQERPSGPGRPVGSRGRWPDKKKMTKEELMKEAAQNRKLIQDLESEIEKSKSDDKAALDQVSPEMWAMLPVMIYDFLSFRFGDHWKLKEAEARIYGEQLGLVANKYLGEMAGDKPELVGLVLVAGIVTLPRAVMSIKLKLSKPETEGGADRAGVQVQEKTKKEKGKADVKTNRGDNSPGATGIG